MAETIFNPSIHTPQFFKDLVIRFDNNKTKMASHLGICRSTLYNWLERTFDDNMNSMDNAIRLVSFENLTKYLEIRSEIDRNGYLLGQITGDRKPLRSNTLLIIGAIRNMLEEYNYHG